MLCKGVCHDSQTDPLDVPLWDSHPNWAIADSGRDCTTKPAQGTAYI